MNKLDADMVKRIQSYPEEMTNTDVGKELGVDRRTVSKYRKMKN
jgi:DNA-binding transcriptional regulator LsrR (DeoR family)